MPQSSLNGARAAVLSRLWGALAREPIGGLGEHHRDGAQLVVTLQDGREVRGPADAAVAFAREPAGLRLSVDGHDSGDGHDSVDVHDSVDGHDSDDPASVLRALRLPYPAPIVAGLVAELDNSVANLALARAAQPPPTGGEPALRRAHRHSDPLAFLEQCVVDGHPLHPCCRTRLGLSPEEVLAYAPEHRPVVGLRYVTVPARRWLGVHCQPVLPVHPWQWEHVLDRYHWLAPDPTPHPARPLMSLRTLALVDSPARHVKTAVDVQMTSAVRTVSPAAIHNGPAISALLAEVSGRIPQLVIFPEVAAGAALVDGEPCRSLAAVHRDVPALAPGELMLPLAALAAPSPADGRPLVLEVVRRGYAGDPLAFIAALARLALPPLLTLLRLGIALEAHGQNLLVILREGRLARLAYRDMGGVRVSPARLRHHGISAPELRGDIASDDPDVLRTKLLASLVSTVVSQMVAVLGADADLDEAAAWGQVAAAARSVRRALPASDRGDVDAVFADTLPVKATTAMRLAADPLTDLWAHLPNPMAGLAP